MLFSPHFMLAILSKHERYRDIVSVESVDQEPGVAPLQNFLSEVLRITIHIRLKNNERKRVKVIVKKGQHGQSICGFQTDITYFKTESKAYSFLDDVYKLAKARDANTKKLWPDCLYSNVESNPFVIMLQDLKETGYTMWPKGRSLLDKEHVYLAVKCLGKCHAMSRLYIEENTADLNSLPEPKFCFLSDYFKKGLKVVGEAVKIYDEKWSYIADYLNKVSGSVMDKYTTCYRAVKNDFPVLALGDCWSTNILFKYSDSESGPIDVRFIDFQFSCFTSFVWDLQYLLFLTLLPKARIENMESLISTYQCTFAQTLSDLGGDPLLAPTFDQISSSLDKLLFTEFLMSTISAVVINSASDENYHDGSIDILLDWYIKDAEQNGYIENIKYFETKGLFKYL